MMNNVMLVGRIANDPIKEVIGGKEVTKISLAVNRAFKNAEGIYETDFIDCILWEGLATNLMEYCKKGDVVGVRGRLQVEYNEDKNKITNVIVEKLTFLSSRSEEIKKDIDNNTEE